MNIKLQIKNRMNNRVLNEGYSNQKVKFDYTKGSNISLGNQKYIDFSMCAGSILLGHNHTFVRKKIEEALTKGISNIAAPNKFADKFANNICKIIPGSEKIIFCNSGTEAVLKALRISRAINKKNKIGYVIGGWHGSVDSLLYKANNKNKPIELSSGLSKDNLKNLVMLPYNDIKNTKTILNKNKDKLSSIIIEPIQGALPYSNIKDYLKYLRNYCSKNKITLIFDEMITGLRTNGTCVQNYFNIKADITLIGKCFGAGFPIGLISINKTVFKKINKLNKRVFFGGTFSGNSFISYIGNETLNYIKKNKKKIFNQINSLAKKIEIDLNLYFEKKNLDLKIYRFKSMLRVVYSNKNIKNRISRDFLEEKKSYKIIKFKKYIHDNKIYIPGSGLIFISYSHSKEQINHLIKTFKTGSIKFLS